MLLCNERKYLKIKKCEEKQTGRDIQRDRKRKKRFLCQIARTQHLKALPCICDGMHLFREQQLCVFCDTEKLNITQLMSCCVCARKCALR